MPKLIQLTYLRHWCLARLPGGELVKALDRFVPSYSICSQARVALEVKKGTSRCRSENTVDAASVKTETP
jgi:hypothetical protein